MCVCVIKTEVICMCLHKSVCRGMRNKEGPDVVWGEDNTHMRQTLGIIHRPTPDSRVICLHRIEDIRCNQSEKKKITWFGKREYFISVNSKALT